MPLTARQLNRATLHRQLLLHRAALDVPEAVRRVVALQAQEPASPYLALWSRVVDFAAAALDTAFVDHIVVRATLVRATLHAVHAEDYPAFHEAMEPRLRATRLLDQRFTRTGLTADHVDRVVPDLLAFAQEPRSRTELEALLADRLGTAEPRAWWALKTFAPLVHAPTASPWSFRPRSSFVAPHVPPHPQDRQASLQRLVRRYLEGFGPASVLDAAQFTFLQRAVVRDALRGLGDQVVELRGPDGTTLFDVPDGPVPAADAPAPPRLLPMWDSVLLAYTDRSRVTPADYRHLVIRRNGDVLPTVLVDGQVAGVWRPVQGGIEATAFQRLPRDAWTGLAAEAAALGAFLAERDAAVYRRYAHWWRSLPPSAEVRVLPA